MTTTLQLTRVVSSTSDNDIIKFGDLAFTTTISMEYMSAMFERLIVTAEGIGGFMNGETFLNLLNRTIPTKVISMISGIKRSLDTSLPRMDRRTASASISTLMALENFREDRISFRESIISRVASVGNVFHARSTDLFVLSQGMRPVQIYYQIENCLRTLSGKIYRPTKRWLSSKITAALMMMFVTA